MIARIPLDNLKSGFYETLHESFSDVGAFVLTEHGVTEETTKITLEASKKFFDLPQEEKNRLILPNRGTGYLPFKSEALGSANGEIAKVDLRESINVKTKNYTNSGIMDQTPAGLFSAVPELEHLSNILIEIFEKALEMPTGWINKTMFDNDSIYRVAHYPATTGVNEDQTRVGAHTDYGLFTLLSPFEEKPSLELYSQTLKCWESTGSLGDGILLNIGDILQHFSNGRWESCLHRVIGRGAEPERTSAIYFCNPNKNARIEPFVQSHSKQALPSLLAKDILDKKSENARDSNNFSAPST